MVKHPVTDEQFRELRMVLCNYAETHNLSYEDIRKEFQEVRAWLWKRHRWVWFWDMDTLEDMVDAYLALKWRFLSHFLNFEYPYQSFSCNTWLPFSEMNELLNRSSP